MKRALIVCGCLLLALNAVAQEGPDEEIITHGQFARLLLAVGAFQKNIPQGEGALVQAKRLGLIPPDWESADPLTHGELADVLAPLGIQYVPTDRDRLASTKFVEALLRREIWKLRDYIIAVHGSPQPIPVSPSEFP